MRRDDSGVLMAAAAGVVVVEEEGSRTRGSIDLRRRRPPRGICEVSIA